VSESPATRVRMDSKARIFLIRLTSPILLSAPPLINLWHSLGIRVLTTRNMVLNHTIPVDVVAVTLDEKHVISGSCDITLKVGLICRNIRFIHQCKPPLLRLYQENHSDHLTFPRCYCSNQQSSRRSGGRILESPQFPLHQNRLEQ